MSLHRRGFLKALLAAPVVAAGALEIDWERLLWTPKSMIVVPGSLALDDLNAVTVAAMLPCIYDDFFKAPPLLEYLKSRHPITITGPVLQVPLEYD